MNIFVFIAVSFVSLVANGVIGTSVVYPVQPPGTSPFEQKGVTNFGLIMLVQFVVFVSIFILLPYFYFENNKFLFYS